ncbi:MAG TPA: tetratricopeptide repeat protein, partial [Candidatus Hydrogenedentes bacterium]|nr:tetratricopeptide repeat protein [Candidatus Hydrogenedentota bacterium]
LEVVEKQPNNPRANVGLATVCFQEGNWDGAVTLALEARAKGGDHFATVYLIGRAARLAGDISLSNSALEDADVLLEKSIETNPDQPEAHYLRGEVAYTLEQYGKAIQYYQQAEAKARKGRVYSAWGEHFSREDIRAKWGLCLQHLGKIETARKIGQRILQTNPKHKIGRALADL